MSAADPSMIIQWLTTYTFPIVVSGIVIAFVVLWLWQIVFPSMKRKAQLQADKDQSEHDSKIQERKREEAHAEKMRAFQVAEREASIRLVESVQKAHESVQEMLNEISKSQRSIVGPVGELLVLLRTLIDDHHEGWRFETVAVKTVLIRLLSDWNEHETIRPETADECIAMIGDLLKGTNGEQS